MRKVIFGTLLVLGFFVSVHPQTQPDKRQQLVAQTESFLESVLSDIEDPGTRALVGARAASTIWPDDQVFARKLFTRSLELTAPGQSQKTEFHRLRLAKIRAEIVKIVRKHDPQLVENETPDTPVSFEVDLDEGFSLIKNDSRAAGQYIFDQLARGINDQRMLLLRQLRGKDPQTADSIFLSTLTKLSQAATVDENHLSLLGTYVLTSSFIQDPQDTQGILSIPGPTGVRVVDLRTCRPGMDPTLVAAFSQSFVRLMERLPSDPVQRELYYLTAKMLQPRIAVYARELYSSFASIMAGLEKEVESRRTNQYDKYLGKDCSSLSATEVASEFNKDLEKKLDDITKQGDQVERDWQRLDLFLQVWDAGKLEAAGKVVEAFEDLGVRQQALNLLRFTQARQLMKKGEVIEARKLVLQLPQESLVVALLWLGLAQAQAADKVAAAEDIQLSLRAVRKLDASQKANLLLNAASQMAPLDATVSLRLLGESCLAFGQEDPNPTVATSWNVEIKVGSRSRKLFLKPELSLGWEANLPSIIKADRPGVAEAIRSLPRDQLKGTATVIFVTEVLRKTQ